MNRRSLFRSLIGLPLLPLAAKAVANAQPAPEEKVRAQMLNSTTIQYVYPSVTSWHYVSCSGGGGGGYSGGASGGPWTCGSGGGAA